VLKSQLVASEGYHAHQGDFQWLPGGFNTGEKIIDFLRIVRLNHLWSTMVH
jgi:hypothetical protein